MEQLRKFETEKIGLKIKYILVLFLAFTAITVNPLYAQDTEVPRTRTFPGIENPTFPYAQPEEVGLSIEKLNLLGDEIESWVANDELVGGELLIIKNGKTIFHEAYGWSDREERHPMERNSIFDTKSMAKPVTATAILILIEEGKLSLNDPVKKHIPNYPDNETKIHHLLSQTSGFDVTPEINLPDSKEFTSLDDWIDALVKSQRAVPLGTFRYTDANHAFLSFIGEKVSGIPLNEFIEKKIFNPLNLQDIYTANSCDTIWAPRINSSYMWDHRGNTYRRYRSRKNNYQQPFYPGSSGLFSTAMDYAAFMAMWLNKGQGSRIRILSETTVEEALQLHGVQRPDTGYGYSWEISNSPREDNMPWIFSHGGIDGTYAMAIPSIDAIIVYFTQSRGRMDFPALMNRIGMLEIFDASGPYAPYLITPDQHSSRDIEIGSGKFTQYEGAYRENKSNKSLDPEHIARVWLEGGRLHIRFGQFGNQIDFHTHLVPIGDHRFAIGRYRNGYLEAINPQSEIEFSVIDQEVKAINLNLGPIRFIAQRTDLEQLTTDIEEYRKQIPIDKIILESLEKKGVAAAKQLHQRLLKSLNDSILFHENLLNSLGYWLLSEERKEEAIAVFEMNVEAYPKAANPYDSLADAYREAGRLEDAKRNYERAVQLAEQQEHQNLEAYRGKLNQVIQKLEKK